jgi:hypothetical protein
MKKLKLIAVIAVAGALGLSARATTVTNADVVTIKATITLQTNNIETGDTTKFAVTKLKVTTKDVLGLIDGEFGTTFGNTNGTQLAVDSFEDGEFSVLDKNGNVLIADASSDADDYELGIEYDNSVLTGSETAAKETEDWTATSDFFYNSADDASSFDVEGSSTIDQVYTDPKDSESFDLSGAGDAEINGDGGVITGAEVKGEGKNNDNVNSVD